MKNVTKEEIIAFCQEEFPGATPKFGNGWWHVPAGSAIGDGLHYEYCDGEIELHNESNDLRWSRFRDYLRDYVKDNRVRYYKGWYGRNAATWKLEGGQTDDWEEIKTGFRIMKSIFQPYIAAWNMKCDEGIDTPQTKTEPSGDVTAFKATVKELLALASLNIPEYQRPYRWTQRNVEQLLTDINSSRVSGKLDYLIGSLILHDNSEKTPRLDIVDGQQRITTICLILTAMTEMGVECEDAVLPNLKYKHTDSFEHIRHNYSFIKEWITINIPETSRRNFYDYLRNNCKMMRVTVKQLPEAFQLFETQNGRGKALEAYNLLKAFHIRAMSDAPRKERIECDVRWEDAALFRERRPDGEHRVIDLLKQVLNEHLYRIRLWSRGAEAAAFTRKEVDEFKGVSLGRDNLLDFAYQNILLQQQIALGVMQMMNGGMFKIKSRFEHGDPDNMSPFVSINQLMINGKTFFDYIETYVETYKRLFVHSDSSQLAIFKQFYLNKCKYPGYLRKGDTYLRQVYKSAIMLAFDRFGERGVIYLYEPLYLCLYKLRLSQKQIKYQGLCKAPEVLEIFSTLQHAKTLNDLSGIKRKAHEAREVKVNFESLPPEIVNYFRNNE